MLRSIAIFLVAALASPLCCCLGAGLSASLADAAAAELYACCPTNQDETQACEGGECPHQLLRSSQILELAPQFALAKAAECAAPLPLWQLPSLRESDPQQHAVAGRHYAASPPGGLAVASPRVAYCRFLV